jgi:hypothetical protein
MNSSFFRYVILFFLVAGCHSISYPDKQKKINSGAVNVHDTLRYTMKTVKRIQQDTAARDSGELIRSVITWPEFDSNTPAPVLDSITQNLQINAFNHFSTGADAVNEFVQSTVQKSKVHRSLSYKGWVYFANVQVVKNSKKLLTLRYVTYGFTGGAHGNPSVIYINIDPTNGRQITWSDILVKDRIRDFLSINANALRSERHIAPAQSFKDAGLFVPGNSLPLPHSFACTSNGLLICYNYYEISSYAQGVVMYTIPYAALKGILNENYVVN